MPRVRLTPHLFQFFPQLRGQELIVEAATARDVVVALEQLAPGIAFYLCDEAGRLRVHVNFFIGNQMIRDRGRLSDSVVGAAEVHILQALSGG